MSDREVRKGFSEEVTSELKHDRCGGLQLLGKMEWGRSRGAAGTKHGRGAVGSRKRRGPRWLEQSKGGPRRGEGQWGDRSSTQPCGVGILL